MFDEYGIEVQSAEEAAAEKQAREAWDNSRTLRKKEGYWVPACGGTEKPFRTRSGHQVQYLWNPVTGDHNYIDLGTDILIPDEDLKYYGLGAEAADLYPAQ